MASIKKASRSKKLMRGVVKTRTEPGEFITSLPDSGKSLHKKIGKSFPIFAECTKSRWIGLDVYLEGDE